MELLNPFLTLLCNRWKNTSRKLLKYLRDEHLQVRDIMISQNTLLFVYVPKSYNRRIRIEHDNRVVAVSLGNILFV